MDIQKCFVCGREFDFEKEGLGSSLTGNIVCGSECAKKHAENEGNDYAIHDKTDKIIETNVDELKEPPGGANPSLSSQTGRCQDKLKGARSDDR